jgi:hypothetical protein
MTSFLCVKDLASKLPSSPAPARRHLQLRKAAYSMPRMQEAKNQYITNLHKYGYAVIPTEAEASEVSLMIEDEIRHGIVMGTRAFNKKFYIATKNFIIKNTTKLLNLIRTKPMGVGDIAAAAELNPEGARAILYILSESGEVTEVRKDIFKAV